MMKNVASSITLEDVIKKHKVPSTHAYSLKHVVDKTIKMGKLEGSVVVRKLLTFVLKVILWFLIH